MKILIIGATRGVGKALAECGLNDGFEVSILARDPSKIAENLQGAATFKGDIRDPKSLTEAVRGQEAVCSCIGVPITFKPVDLFSVGAKTLIDVMKESGVKTYITVTGIGTGDSKGHGGFLYDRIFKPLFLKTIYEDKDQEENIVKSSDLDWLIVRPAGLTNGPRTGSYNVFTDLEGVTSKRISRMDVADFILKQLKNPTHFGKTPLLTY